MLKRVLVAVIVLVVLGSIGLYWVVPVVFSIYSSKTALPITRVVPVALEDASVTGTGKKLAYFGYEFEVPWADVDENQTKVQTLNGSYSRVVLSFRSGLRLAVTSVPPKEGVSSLPAQINVSPREFEKVFGREMMQSDYAFAKTLYEFDPDQMHHWAPMSSVHVREQSLLLLKSITLSKAAETGIFRVQNSDFKGFQQGGTKAHPDTFVISLYSNSGNIEFIVSQKNYGKPAGVTQPEINRLIQSVRRISS